MTTEWNFSYYSFVKFHGEETWEPHDHVDLLFCLVLRFCPSQQLWSC